MNRPDLIDQLKQLNPTEGEWIDSYGLIESNDVALFDRRSATTTDCLLVSLAPQMRTAILEMAKEIEGLRNEILKLKKFNSTKKILGDKPKIQMVTACERFKQPNPSNDYCMNCGKSKYLHVTPNQK